MSRLKNHPCVSIHLVQQPQQGLCILESAFMGTQEGVPHGHGSPPPIWARPTVLTASWKSRRQCQYGVCCEIWIAFRSSGFAASTEF